MASLPVVGVLSFSVSCLSFGGKLADPDGRIGEFPMSLESGDGVGRGGRVLETTSSEAEERPVAAQPPVGPLTVSSGDQLSGEGTALTAYPLYEHDQTLSFEPCSDYFLPNLLLQPVNMSTVPREMRERVRPPNAGGGETILIASSPGSGRGEMASPSEELGSCQGCSALRRRLEEFEMAVDTRFFCVT
ncbi:UNVERIFIED_CONTAM: hypothetical protein K2H54_065595 [Gekko kuhli]